MGGNGFVHALSIQAAYLGSHFLCDQLLYNNIHMEIYYDFIHILVGMLVIWIMSLALLALFILIWVKPPVWISDYVPFITSTKGRFESCNMSPS